MTKLLFTDKGCSGKIGDFVSKDKINPVIFPDEMSFIPVGYPTWGRKAIQNGQLICASHDTKTGHRYTKSAGGYAEVGDAIDCKTCQMNKVCKFSMSWTIYLEAIGDAVVWDLSYGDGFKQFAPSASAWKDAIFGLKQSLSNYYVKATTIAGRKTNYYKIITERYTTDEERATVEPYLPKKQDENAPQKTKKAAKKIEEPKENIVEEDEDIPF